SFSARANCRSQSRWASEYLFSSRKSLKFCCRRARSDPDLAAISLRLASRTSGVSVSPRAAAQHNTVASARDSREARRGLFRGMVVVLRKGALALEEFEELGWPLRIGRVGRSQRVAVFVEV